LQAGGRRFDPDRLHHGLLFGMIRCAGLLWVGIGFVSWNIRDRLGDAVERDVPPCGLPCLFFVRVNQVLVRLWARVIAADP
jgi:hypothetical protein